MSEVKGMQLLDKMTRHRIFNCKYWKEECFGLNAQTLIDKAVKIKYIGGLYSGAKKPTKFLCLFFKMLQMNLPKEIVVQYLKAREYKYLTALSLLYLRFTTKAPEIYETLEPFYNDNRKLRIRDSIGRFSITYIDQLADQLLSQEAVMGLMLPFIQKRIVYEQQGQLQVRVSMLQEDLRAIQQQQPEQNEHNH